VRDFNLFPAVRWHKNGDHPFDYLFDDPTNPLYNAAYRKQNHWEGDVVRYYRRPDVPGLLECSDCGNVMDSHGWIDSGKDGRRVCPGDWVITIDGEYYPMKPDLYAALNS